MHRFVIFVIFLLQMATAASATDLVISLRSPSGAAVKDVVAMAYPGGRASPIRGVGQGVTMAQRNLKFIPFMLAVPVGTSVRFPNYDNVKHQVYSFSPAKKFSIALYGKDESRSVLFDKAGNVAVGCNIHDAMVSYIKVVDTGIYGQSGGDGTIVLRGLPAGNVTIRLWHPYQKTAGGEQVITVAMPASGTVQRSVSVILRTPPSRANY